MSGGAVLDVLLLVLLLGYAASGAQRGFVHGAFALAGFLLGGLTGIVMLPRVLESLTTDDGRPLLQPGLGRVLVVVAAVLALAALGQVLGALAGRLVRARLTWRPARVADAALGAVAALVAVALLTWFVAGAVRASPLPGIARAVGQSQVVRAVDQVVPPGAGTLAQGLRGLVESGGFPRVFEGVGPEVILPVDPPDAAPVAGAAAAAAGGIVKITGTAAACHRGQEGTGFVVAPERVVTNAHVVAGVPEPVVQVGGQGDRHRARVVLMDPDRDLAVLAVPGLPARPLPLAPDLARGDTAVVAGFPLNGPYSSAPARVRQVLTARGENIYGEPGVDRRVYALYTTVEPGNSGGPLLDPAGRVVGVIFAKSLDDPQTGYALTMEEARPVLEQAASSREPVDPGRCTTA